MGYVNIHLVNFFARFACTSMLIAQFGTVVVQGFIWAHGWSTIEYCEQVISSWPRRLKLSLL